MGPIIPEREKSDISIVYRHDSASDSVSSSTAEVFAGLAAIPLALVFSGVCILIISLINI